MQLPVYRALLETTSPDAVKCTEAHQFLTDVMPVKGFHVLCIETTTTDTCVNPFVRVTGLTHRIEAINAMDVVTCAG